MEEPASPMHDKARPHAEAMQAIGEFVEWLQDAKHLRLGSWDTDQFWPAHYDIQKLLAEFYDIDYEAYLKEKDEALKYIREVNGIGS